MRVGLHYTVLVAALAACTGTSSSDSESELEQQLDVQQSDLDGDGILDVHEGNEDVDGDGVPNDKDDDSDGDGLSDSLEAGDLDVMTLPVDSDGDGAADFLDLDSDDNCIEDAVEGRDGGRSDEDFDGEYDFRDFDNDGDGIDDVLEIGDTEMCRAADTDGDGTPDYMDLDSDGDGVGDMWEGGTSEWNDEPTDTDGDGIPDFQDTDSDGDGISDAHESGVGETWEEPRDTDGDGLYDFQDTDSDGDGLDDRDEVDIYGTDPYDFDTDGDGFSDGGEVLAETDPNDPTEGIDGVYVEVGERTDREETFSFELRIQQGDIAFLLDTTGSMYGTADAMGDQFNDIVQNLSVTFEDVATGFATFDDYACCGFGSSGTDLPFIYRVGITDNEALMQSELLNIQMHSGNDGWESTIEAIYQTLTGHGYDMGCDGSYQSNTDVRPFVASAADPFNGSGGENIQPTSLGDRGGLGFREYSLPIVVYATDYEMRDPESPNPSVAAVPGGCPLDASSSDVVSALGELGGYLIGADVSGGSAWGPYTGMLDLAMRTGSYADIDGDGDADEPLVFALDQNTLGFNEEFTEAVTSAVDQLVQSIVFNTVTLEVEGDEYGFVVDIDPEEYTNIDPEAQQLDFDITFRGTVPATIEDQLYLLTLNIIGDGTTLLDSKDIVILVPGTAF